MKLHIASDKVILPIIGIVLVALSFRLFGINWDQGHHLHPDERMLIMVTERLHLPKTPTEWKNLFTPESPLNPKFFAYGSFPIYLLKIVSTIFQRAHYDGMLLIGRLISTLFDLGTVFLVFLIGKEILRKSQTPSNKLQTSTKHQATNYKQRVSNLVFRNWDLFGIWNLEFGIFPILAAFFYAVSVLPIQSSHFFISDMPLTFLTTLLLFLLIRFITKKQQLVLSSIIGIVFGLMIATKISAVIAAAPLILTLLVHAFTFKRIRPLFISMFLIGFFSVLSFAITMPYGIIDFDTFKRQTIEQSRMRVDPFVFPYTLQYVNTTPYWYFVKNIVLWGMGPPLGLLSIVGTVVVTALWFTHLLRFIRRRQEPSLLWRQLSILLGFFFVYFAFMGNSAVKFMRYMLPLYPLLYIFGSLFVLKLIGKLKNFQRSLLLLTILSVLLWPVAFRTIFTKTHTRIEASEWIYNNIPPGATIATEHWDDGLPLNLSGKFPRQYSFLELPLYEADTSQKWDLVNQRLNKTQYIIIASNRLYTPLMKLTDCNRLPKEKCYPITAAYYQDLFAGRLGFQKVAQFASYPTIPILNIPIVDDTADESFTVYDHPKIMIFKK